MLNSNNNIQRIKDKLIGLGIKLNEPILLKDIKDIEKNFNILFPEELSLFYTEIGNGCEMIDGFNLKKVDELIIDKEKINEEFPFTKYWIWEDDDNEKEDLFDKVENGNIELINIGDSQGWNIIITGKERGQMWFFTDVGIQPCAPERSFLSWFEFWLDGNDNYFEKF